MEHSIELEDQMSSSRTLWGPVMSALTHPSVRLVQGNVPRAGFMEFVLIVFGMYIKIPELCTFIIDRIDQQCNVLILKQCHWNVELTTGTQFLYVSLYCGYAIWKCYLK
jgi:hypothetical protein